MRLILVPLVAAALGAGATLRGGSSGSAPVPSGVKTSPFASVCGRLGAAAPSNSRAASQRGGRGCAEPPLIVVPVAMGEAEQRERATEYAS